MEFDMHTPSCWSLMDGIITSPAPDDNREQVEQTKRSCVYNNCTENVQQSYQHPPTSNCSQFYTPCAHASTKNTWYTVMDSSPSPGEICSSKTLLPETRRTSCDWSAPWQSADWEKPFGKKRRRRTISAEQRKAANVRERKRMYQLNDAFDLLRQRVPTFAYEKKLSRIETLNLAVTYIQFMAEMIENNGEEKEQTASEEAKHPRDIARDTGDDMQSA